MNSDNGKSPTSPAKRALQHTDCGVCLFDYHGKVRSVNEKFASHMGLAPSQDPAGLTVTSLFHQTLQKSSSENHDVRQFLRLNGKDTAEISVATLGGRRLRCHHAATADGGGVITTTDIADERTEEQHPATGVLESFQPGSGDQISVLLTQARELMQVDWCLLYDVDEISGTGGHYRKRLAIGPEGAPEAGLPPPDVGEVLSLLKESDLVYLDNVKPIDRGPDSSLQPFLCLMVNLRDREGQLIGAFGVAQAGAHNDLQLLRTLFDILARRCAEALQAERSENLRGGDDTDFSEFMGIAGDWSWEMDARGSVRFISESVEKFTGYSPDFYVGKTRSETAASYDLGYNLTSHNDPLLAHLEKRQEFRNVYIQIRKKDGSPMWVSISGRPFNDDQGRFAGFRGVSRDVTLEFTSGKDADSKLARLTSTMHALSIGLLYFDAAGSLQDWNPLVEILLPEVSDSLQQGIAYGEIKRLLNLKAGPLRFEDRQMSVDTPIAKDAEFFSNGVQIASVNGVALLFRIRRLNQGEYVVAIQPAASREG